MEKGIGLKPDILTVKLMKLLTREQCVIPEQLMGDSILKTRNLRQPKK